MTCLRRSLNGAVDSRGRTGPTTRTAWSSAVRSMGRRRAPTDLNGSGILVVDDDLLQWGRRRAPTDRLSTCTPDWHSRRFNGTVDARRRTADGRVPSRALEAEVPMGPSTRADGQTSSTFAAQNRYGVLQWDRGLAPTNSSHNGRRA